MRLRINNKNLIYNVRFKNGNNIAEDLLFSKNISAGAKAEDLFEIINTFISESNLDWTKCVDVCTDRTRCMCSCYGRLQALVRSKGLDALWTHCIIHRKTLTSKHLSTALNQVLEYTKNLVNFIKTRPLKTKAFRKTAVHDFITYL